MLDRNEVLNQISTQDVIDILTELGDGTYKKSGENLCFSTYNCHFGDSPYKLFYYPESKMFKCYTCNESKSLFDIIGGLLNLDFSQSFKWLCNYKGVKNTRQQFRGFKSRDSENKDLEFLKLHSYKRTQNEIIIPE